MRRRGRFVSPRAITSNDRFTLAASGRVRTDAATATAIATHPRSAANRQLRIGDQTPAGDAAS
jgi:hypothetical protein